MSYVHCGGGVPQISWSMIMVADWALHSRVRCPFAHSLKHPTTFLSAFRSDAHLPQADPDDLLPRLLGGVVTGEVGKVRWDILRMEAVRVESHHFALGDSL